MNEKKHILDEKEFQKYCAYKHIEPQIKGCLDRERELEKKLKEKEKEHKEAMKNALNDFLTLRQELKQEKISFAIEQLLDIKEKSFGTRKLNLIYDIPTAQSIFKNIEDKLKELMEK